VPRYFFDVQDGAAIHIDDIGDDLPGLDAVCREAMELLSDLARPMVPNGRERALTSTVRGEAGNGVYKATLSLTGTRLE
jgi:hypothetical protein